MKITLEEADIVAIATETAEKVIEALKLMLSYNAKDDRLMTTDELCEYLKVKRDWVYQQRYAGTIPYLKSGGKLCFRKSEIDEYLKNHKK